MSTKRHRRPVRSALASALLLALVTANARADHYILVTDGGDAGDALTCTLRQALVTAGSWQAVGNCPQNVSQSEHIVVEMAPWLANYHLMLEQGQLYLWPNSLFFTYDLRVDLLGHGLVIDAHQASRVLYYKGVADAFMRQSLLVLKDTTLTGGNVPYNPQDSSDSVGGGIRVEAMANLYLVRSRVTGNTAIAGGGIHAFGVGATMQTGAGTRPSVNLIDSSIDGNTTTRPIGGGPHLNYRGGGLCLLNSGGVILRSTIANNQSLGAGGGIYAWFGGNDTSDSYQYPNHLMVFASTISGNTIVDRGEGYDFGGSGFYAYGEKTYLKNVTVTGNTGAVYSAVTDIGWPATSGMTITNSIISGNIANPRAPVNADFSLRGQGNASASHSVFGSGVGYFSSGDNLFTDATLLGDLADNGGFVPTQRPLAGSPVVDVGDDVACATTPVIHDFRGIFYNYLDSMTFDARGVARPQGAHCDAGAVEVRERSFTIAANATGQGRIDASPPPSGAGSSGGIANCTSMGGAACAATYVGENDISTLTFTATPATGWHLDGWSGDCIASQRDAGAWLTVDDDRACNASFAIDTHTIGGVVQGLTGSGLMLQLDGGNDLPIAADGHFTFAPALDYGTPYVVTIGAQPSAPAQTCFIPHGSGVADHDIDDIAVICAEQPIPVAVSVAIDDGATIALPGDTPAYVITVRNDGDATAYDVALATHATPAGALEALAWSCDGGCSSAGGNGDVEVDMDVPAHAQAVVLLHGTVAAFSGDSLDVSAQVTVPDWYVDATGTHVAIDSNVNPTIFRDGFDRAN